MRIFVAAVACGLVCVVGAAAKGNGPTTMVASYGAAWVGFGDGTIRRIDARTLHAGRPIGERVGGRFIHGLAAGFGYIWAAPGNSLLRIDPRTRRVRVFSWRRWAPDGVAVARGAVWLLDYDSNSVLQLDPRRLRVVRRIAFDGQLLSLAAGPAGVWAMEFPGVGQVEGPAGPRLLVRVDESASPVQFACDQAVVVGRDALFAADACSPTLTRVNAAGVQTTTVGVAGGGVAVGFGSVWIAGAGIVERIDPETLTQVAVVYADGLGVTAGAGALWVLRSDGDYGLLTRIDPRTNLITGELRLR